MQVVIVDCNYRPDAPHPVFVALADRLAIAGVALTVDNAWSDTYPDADLIISADPLRDRPSLHRARVLGQRTLNRFERMEIAARHTRAVAAFASPENDDQLSTAARDWGDICVLKYDWSSRRNGVFLWPLGAGRLPFPSDFRPGCDLFMAFIEGDPLTYKIDAFCGTILGSWIFPTRSMRDADWQIVSASEPVAFDPPPPVRRAIESVSEALVSYGVGYASYDLMQAKDGFKLIEINSCSVSTQMWNDWPDRYAESYPRAILRTLKRLDTLPRFSQLRRLAQRAGNDQAAVALKERPGSAPSPVVAPGNAHAVPDIAPSAELSFFNDLAKTERLTQPLLIQFWQRALADLLRHAHQTTPFYRDRLSRLLAHDDDIEWSRWFELPIIRFDDIARLRHAMLSRSIPSAHGSVSPYRVAGPTGEVAVVSKSSLQLGAESCIWARLGDWHGIDQAETMATLLPPTALLPGERESWVPKWRPGPHGTHHIGDVESPARQQCDWLTALGPIVLRTAPALLRPLLDAAGSISGPRIRLKQVVTEGETVAEDDRQRCRDALGSDIVDAYALPEAGIVAIRCPATGNYHLQSEVCLVEVLDDDHKPCGSDGIGEIVITPLYAFAMPLVRYATGTYAQLLSGSPNANKSCACGRGLPAIRKVFRKMPTGRSPQ
jgi:phenylacetate-CoA ligase